MLYSAFLFWDNNQYDEIVDKKLDKKLDGDFLSMPPLTSGPERPLSTG